MRRTALYGLLTSLLMFSSLTSAKPTCAQALTGRENMTNLDAPERIFAPSDFLKVVIDALKPSPSARDFSFDGAKLSSPQLRALARFASKTGSPLQKGDHIRIARFEDMESKVHASGIKQYVFQNEVFETGLIEKSLIDSTPRRVLTFRLHYRDGRVAPTPILIRGDLQSVDFSDGFHELRQHLRGKTNDLEAIEIVHTQPTYSVLITSASGSAKLLANEISSADVHEAQEFSLGLPPATGVILTNIFPNGFNYKAVWVRR